MKGCPNLATFMKRKGMKDVATTKAHKKGAEADVAVADDGVDDDKEGPASKKAKKGGKDYEKMA